MVQRKSYRVAGHVFSLAMQAEDKVWSELDNYSPFACEERDGIFSLVLTEALEIGGKEELYLTSPDTPGQRIDIFKVEDGFLFEMAPLGKATVCGWLKVSRDFSEGRLKAEDNRLFCVNNALMLMYAFRTASLGTIEMHASVTVKDGKGYLFLGKSGTGKSTHSRLWLKNIPGTHLLNDDNPVIRLTGGEARVYGTPWSGKTPCYRNEDYPVGAIVRIRRAGNNAIRKMSLAESFASVSSSSSGLRAIRSIGDGLFATISTVVQEVPCYLLDCLPDDGAAIVCSNGVLGDAQRD